MHPKNVGVAPIDEKMTETHLRLFGYMFRRLTETSDRTKKGGFIGLSGER